MTAAEQDRALVERLRALEAKATAPPWRVCEEDEHGFHSRSLCSGEGNVHNALVIEEFEAQPPENFTLLAEVRNALPRLLALAERGLAERADVCAWLRLYAVGRILAADIERGDHERREK